MSSRETIHSFKHSTHCSVRMHRTIWSHWIHYSEDLEFGREQRWTSWSRLECQEIQSKRVGWQRPSPRRDCSDVKQFHCTWIELHFQHCLSYCSLWELLLSQFWWRWRQSRLLAKGKEREKEIRSPESNAISRFTTIVVVLVVELIGTEGVSSDEVDVVIVVLVPTIGVDVNEAVLVAVLD